MSWFSGLSWFFGLSWFSGLSFSHLASTYTPWLSAYINVPVRLLTTATGLLHSHLKYIVAQFKSIEYSVHLESAVSIVHWNSCHFHWAKLLNTLTSLVFSTFLIPFIASTKSFIENESHVVTSVKVAAIVASIECSLSLDKVSANLFTYSSFQYLEIDFSILKPKLAQLCNFSLVLAGDLYHNSANWLSATHLSFNISAFAFSVNPQLIW